MNTHRCWLGWTETGESDTWSSDIIAVGRLNPIPEVLQKSERLVTLDCVCRYSTGKEMPMDRKMFRIVQNVIGWSKEHMIGLVLLLSLIHVGLAYIHGRDSG